MDKKERKPIPFDQILAVLLDDTKPFPPRFVYRLSDLEEAELVQLENIWTQVPLHRRRAVLEDVEDFNSDYVLNFYEIARLAVDDSDASVRLIAIRTLAEYEDDDLAPVFIAAAEKDDDSTVRSAASAALGNFIYLGEIEEIPEASLLQVEACLLRVYSSADAKPVRLKALEALGFSSREEVPGIIEAAYHSEDPDWTASALVAMGRSYNKDYHDHVMASLADDRTAIQVEAIIAAGELELSDAVPTLIDALQDEENNIRHSAIWALSKIGGEGVRDTLEHMLDETEDEEEEDILDAALENLEFTEDFARFSLLDFDEDDQDDDLYDKDILEDD
jgi:HEAT repeat protein